MYRRPYKRRIHMISVIPYEGESIEKKVRRIVETKEPISDGAAPIYTEKKDGVRPEFDIRTDKWDLALDAMDKVNADKIAKSKAYGVSQEDAQTKQEQPHAGESSTSEAK